MKDFQIHAMRCTRDRIVVAGTEDARYVFDISRHEGRGPNADDDTDLASEGQLGWPVGGVKTLESFDPQHEYQLVLSNSTKDSEVTRMAEIFRSTPTKMISAAAVALCVALRTGMLPRARP